MKTIIKYITILAVLFCSALSCNTESINPVKGTTWVGEDISYSLNSTEKTVIALSFSDASTAEIVSALTRYDGRNTLEENIRFKSIQKETVYYDYNGDNSTVSLKHKDHTFMTALYYTGKRLNVIFPDNGSIVKVTYLTPVK